MSAQDIWARKYHELWEKLEKNTKDSFCTALWKWLVLTGSAAIVMAIIAVWCIAVTLLRFACSLQKS